MASDDEGVPHLKLIGTSDSSDQDARLRANDRRFAEQKLRYALRKLAANVLRITRGAGKPHEIVRDCAELIEAFTRYEDAFGSLPPIEDVSHHLAFELQEPGKPGWSEEEAAMEEMVRGALQLVASQLLSQKMQISAGRTELQLAAGRYGKLREAERASWQRPSQPRSKPKKPTR